MVKKKVEKISNEDRIKMNLETELKDLRSNLHLISKPTHIFNIGDKVIIGNLEAVTVEEIVEDGKIYKIDFSSTDTNYGNPITTEHQKRYVKWVDIRKFQERTKDKSILIKNTDMDLNYTNRSMGDILSKAYYFGIDFNPDYQRDYVWELNDKIALIDSIFNNIDIGKFAFIKKDYSESFFYEILDGKQRLRAILDFYEDRFQYQDKYFSDLTIREQDHFENYNITMAEVSDLTEEQILKYFLMLNTGGKVMSEEHLNKIREKLNDLNK